MRRRLLIIIFAAAIAALAVAVATALASDTPTVPDKKVAVCKYVGKPGVNEVLKSGENPILVSINALVGPNGATPELGQSFADAQGRSVVVALPGMPVPAQGSCPAGSQAQPATPVDPAVTPATCASGETLALPASTDAIVYTEEGALTGPGTVVVTATAREGYLIAPATGWSVADGQGSATLTVTLAGPRTEGCSAPIAVPQDPVVTAATCTHAETLALPARPETVVYTETGSLTGPGIVVITATAAEGYVLAAAGDWLVAEGGHTATLTVHLAGKLTASCGGGGVKGVTHHRRHHGAAPPTTGSPLPGTAFTF